MTSHSDSSDVPRQLARPGCLAALIALLALLPGCASTEAHAGASSARPAGSNDASARSADTNDASARPADTNDPSVRPADTNSSSVSPAPAGAVTSASSAARPLAGKIVGIDPGHNGGNFSDPNYIDHQIWNGREWEDCDTTGTETDGGYTEARFNFNVASYLAADLRHDGATVVLTRTNNSGVGPCVNRRSEIINRVHADVAVDIHADGGPPGGRGFTILEPLPDGPNDRVIAASQRFGHELRERYRAITGMPVSTYDGSDGISLRDNLAGLNLTTVPKVLIECGNMRNPTDASLLVRSSFQRLAATAIAAAIAEYLG
jgi:N-acetylmuramoyl-L-alanine amidase